MFISQFTVENWQGNQNKSVFKKAINWTEIQTAIRELDGHYKTLVTLETEGEIHMAIGGGTGKYIVYLTFDNETFYYLIDPLKLNTDERLIVGGQEGIYPAKLCVDIGTVMKAAQTFAELGTMEKALIWEKDSVFEAV
jgi:Immunity protein Imm1